MLRGGYSVFSRIVAKQSRAHEHLAAVVAAALDSTRATLDSSSTRTPVVAGVMLRTARAALERTSMSRCRRLLHRKIKHDDYSIARKRRAQDEHEHDVAKQSWAHEHSAALEQHSTRAALARLLLLLLY